MPRMRKRTEQLPIRRKSRNELTDEQERRGIFLHRLLLSPMGERATVEDTTRNYRVFCASGFILAPRYPR